VAVNTASRLALVAMRLSLPVAAVAGIALAAGAAVWGAGRRAWVVVAAALLVGGPIAVERNRARWTTYWNDLKPALENVRGPDLAAFAMDEASYFAGHVVAAGNPVDPRVRALLPEEVAAARPRYLAVLVTPGFDWRAKYAQPLTALGYRTVAQCPDGALLELTR
jgi:hypothetical protein